MFSCRHYFFRLSSTTRLMRSTGASRPVNRRNWSAACPTNMVSPVTTVHPAAAASLRGSNHTGQHNKVRGREREEDNHEGGRERLGCANQKCRNASTLAMQRQHALRPARRQLLPKPRCQYTAWCGLRLRQLLT